MQPPLTEGKCKATPAVSLPLDAKSRKRLRKVDTVRDNANIAMIFSTSGKSAEEYTAAHRPSKFSARRIADIIHGTEIQWLPEVPVAMSMAELPESKATVGSWAAARMKAEEAEVCWTTAEEREFSHQVGFPTGRRPATYRRTLITGGKAEEVFQQGFPGESKVIGDLADTPEKRKQAVSLLATWHDLFIREIRKMPPTDLIQHSIPTRGGPPRPAKPSLYNSAEMEYQKEMLPILKDAGIIEECVSPFCAKTKFVPKPSGKLRMVHPWIALNAVTIKSNYPMKRLEYILQGIAQDCCKVLFKADASNGYWAVPLNRQHQYKTAFHTIYGQFMYLRMGQGLSGGPGTYTRLKDIATGRIPAPLAEDPLDSVMKDVWFGFFMDDDTGGGRDFDSLFCFLHEHYFPRLAWAKLTLNPDKSTFFASQVEILGHTRMARGIRPNVDRIAAFRNWPPPQTEAELKRFCDALPWLKAFIPGRSDKTTIMQRAIIREPTVVMKRGKKKTIHHTVAFDWGSEQQRAFDEIKQSVCETVVSTGDPERQFHLATDASLYGAGGVLFQLRESILDGTPAKMDNTDELVIIAFLSFKFSGAERNYHTTEREALALLKSLAEVGWMFKGRPLPVMTYTDHKALLAIMTGDHTNSRLIRWQLQFMEYDLQIQHVPGRDLTIADGLSRLRSSPGCELSNGQPESTLHLMALDTSNAAPTGGLEPEDVISEQDRSKWADWLEDPWYRDALLYKLTGMVNAVATLQQSFRRLVREVAKHLVLIEGAEPKLGYRERDGTISLCARQREVPQALASAHELHGHFSDRTTLRNCLGRAYWPTRAKDVVAHCRSCPECQFLGPLRPGRNLIPVLAIQPLDMIGMDFIGPITPRGPAGEAYILIAVDYATRFLFARPMKAATALNVVAFLQTVVVQTFGWPRAIYTDNGSHFAGGQLPEVLRRFGVRQFFAPVSHPSSVGLAERNVQLVTAALKRKLQTTPGAIYLWPQWLQEAVWAINSREVKHCGFHPAELLFGVAPHFTGYDTTVEEEIRVQAFADALQAEGEPEEELMAEAARERLARLDEKRLMNLDRRLHQQWAMVDKDVKRWPTPQIGDAVLIRRLQQEKERGHKLEPVWEGPYLLQKVTKNGQAGWVTPLLEDAPPAKYHLNDMKRFVIRKGDGEHWQHTAATNDTVRSDMRKLMRDRRGRKRENEDRHRQGLAALPKNDHRGQHTQDAANGPADPQWTQGVDWDSARGNDEVTAGYWRDRAVTLGGGA